VRLEVLRSCVEYIPARVIWPSCHPDARQRQPGRMRLRQRQRAQTPYVSQTVLPLAMTDRDIEQLPRSWEGLPHGLTRMGSGSPGASPASHNHPDLLIAVRSPLTVTHRQSRKSQGSPHRQVRHCAPPCRLGWRTDALLESWNSPVFDATLQGDCGPQNYWFGSGPFHHARRLVQAGQTHRVPPIDL
jgi:hypothetical protein